VFPPCPHANTFQGVFDVDFATGLTLIEIADGVTVDEIKKKTEAPFKVADDLKPML
jgi:3-oxoacid CoA-transferase